jgi:hypothetical protein
MPPLLLLLAPLALATPTLPFLPAWPGPIVARAVEEDDPGCVEYDIRYHREAAWPAVPLIQHPNPAARCAQLCRERQGGLLAWVLRQQPFTCGRWNWDPATETCYLLLPGPAPPPGTAAFAPGWLGGSLGSCPGPGPLPALPCTCGVRRPLQHKIIGGQDTAEHKYPWYAAWYPRNPNKTDEHLFHCGASLIASSWAVSAAHCFITPAGTWIMNSGEIRLGQHSFSMTRDQGGQDIKVVLVHSVHVHEGYSAARFHQHDIALLRLAEHVDLTLYPPVCLPPPALDFVGSTAFAYGFGLVGLPGPLGPAPFPAVLQEAQVPVVPRADCLTAGLPLLDTMLCGEQDGPGICFGDSGGALSVARDGREVLAGVTSWGGCVAVSHHAVFTGLTDYLPWVARVQAGRGGAALC